MLAVAGVLVDYLLATLGTTEVVEGCDFLTGVLPGLGSFYIKMWRD